MLSRQFSLAFLSTCSWPSLVVSTPLLVRSWSPVAPTRLSASLEFGRLWGFVLWILSIPVTSSCFISLGFERKGNVLVSMVGKASAPPPPLPCRSRALMALLVGSRCPESQLPTSCSWWAPFPELPCVCAPLRLGRSAWNMQVLLVCVCTHWGSPTSDMPFRKG